MGDSERDSTQDWLLPEDSRPPSVAELSQRVDYALTMAKASEAAVVAVGEAALDAAKQARRAAELAERASAAMLGGSRGVQASETQTEPPFFLASSDDRLRSFSERADRVARRLNELERDPLPGVAEVMH